MVESVAMARRAAVLVADALALLDGRPDGEKAAMARDALLLRFPSLVNLLVEHVFRLISESQGLPRPRRTSKRDMLDDMEALDVVSDADRLFDAILLRNRLFPDGSGSLRVAPAEFDALRTASRDLIAALDSAEAWARARGYLPD